MNKIHIGYPKTATTYLQRHIFPQVNSHEFINHEQFRSSGLNSLIWSADRSINYNNLRLKYYKGRHLISFEDLVGPFFQGSLMIDEIPLRLSKIFNSNSKILITIRRQDELLKSLYTQYIHQGGTMKLKYFLKWQIPGNNRIDLNAYNFYETYLRYSDVFGAENVKVIPYEFLKYEKEKFQMMLEEFLPNERFDFGIEKIENRSMSGYQFKLLRFFNKFIMSRQSEKFIIPPSVINQDHLRFRWQRSSFLVQGNTFSSKENEMLKDLLPFYFSSNQLLDERLALNLNKFGYY